MCAGICCEMMCYATLHLFYADCAVQCCAVLCCAVLFSAMICVHHAVLRYAMLQPAALRSAMPCHAMLACYAQRGAILSQHRAVGNWNCTLQMEYLRPLTCSILSERRTFRPYGLLGGHSALPGLNLLLHSDGRRVNMGGKTSVQVKAGDRIQICTPGM